MLALPISFCTSLLVANHPIIWFLVSVVTFCWGGVARDRAIVARTYDYDFSDLLSSISIFNLILGIALSSIYAYWISN